MDISRLCTSCKNRPSYVILENALLKNLKTLEQVRKDTGCEIFLSQKAFSIYQLYPLIEQYLSGVTATSLNEAMLGKEQYMKVITYAPAYKSSEFSNVVTNSDNIVFNSINEYLRYKDLCCGKEIGLRINPEFSTQKESFCNPCVEGSRFGITINEFIKSYPLIKGSVRGIMFHTLSKQDLPDLIQTVRAVENQFGDYLDDFDWISFGGGQHITKEGYDVDGLIKLIREFQSRYSIKVMLEPGEAVGYDAGVLVTEVLDLVKTKDVTNAILDCSPYAHMQDTIFLKTKPNIVGAKKGTAGPYNYRLAGCTCLTGDILGEYSFDTPLCVGDTIIIKNQAIYTMVSNNWFNGLMLPDIGFLKSNGEYEILKTFKFEDYKRNL